MNFQHAAYNQTRKDVKYQELAASKKEVKQVVGDAVAFKYKYNGKEWQDELGLNVYNMDMRQYDPAIARWTSIDPVVHHSKSTYNAFDNNPVYWADPSGKSGEHYNWNNGRYEDSNGNEISFEDALASYGISIDEGHVKPKKKKKISNNALTGRRRLRQRGRNRRRFFSGSLFFDSRGQELFSHWLAGSEADLILDNEEWQDYMRNNELLNSQIRDELYNYLSGIRDDVEKEGILPFHLRFHGEIENGYMTGYEMLHGSSSKLGDTQIYGTVQYNSNTKQFDFNLGIIWNDRIDPNPTYQDDIKLANFFNTFYTPQDYNVKIIWHEKISIK